MIGWLRLCIASTFGVRELLWLLTGAEDVKDVPLCDMKLRAEDITHFRDIIEDLYYFEFIIGMEKITTE